MKITLRTRMALVFLFTAIGANIYLEVIQSQSEFQPAIPNQLILRSDPIKRLGELRRIPTLIVCNDGDRIVPVRENAEAAKGKLGANCRLVKFNGTDHVDPRIYDAEAVGRFISEKASRRPVILLHGYGFNGTMWFQCGKEDGEHRTIAKFGQGLQRKFHCEAGDFAGNAWGNDAAVSALDRLIGDRRGVVLVAASMGGSLMWRYAEAHPEKVAAMVGLSPVCSLTAMCRTRLGRTIVRAYPSN